MNISAEGMRTLLLILCGSLNLIGFLGLFLVFFPGLTVAWVGQLIWVISVGFNGAHQPWQHGLTIGIFVLNTVIMLVGSLLDNILGATRAHGKGIPWWEIGLSLVAITVGGILFTPLGGLILALAILFLTEYFRAGEDWNKAWEGIKAMASGYGIAAILRLVLCLVMILLWVGMVIWL